MINFSLPRVSAECQCSTGNRHTHTDKLEPGLSHLDTFSSSANLPTIAPAAMSTAEKYAFYGKLIAANGGQVAEDKPTVLGLRGLDPKGERHDSNENVGPYNDTFVILKHEKGNPSVTELRGQTHSGQKAGPNAHGVSMIQPGSYKAEPNGPHHKMPSWHVVTLAGAGEIPCWRDANKNGYIDPKEKAAPTVATAILFHTGVNTDHGSSIGCQVMRPDIHKEFIREVGESTEFVYTLVDANLPTPAPAPAPTPLA